MRDVIYLLFDLLTSLAKLFQSGGSRAVIAENLLLKQQLIIHSRSRQRAPNLSTGDRALLGFWSLLLNPKRIVRAAILIAAALMTASSLAQTPIPRQGDSCPSGTYKSADYCKPFKFSEDQAIIQKSDKDCPNGFYKSGNYCKQYSSESDKEAIPRDKGSDCPGGWYKSGGYCVKYSD